MIRDKDITFVIQGPIDVGQSKQCLNSIRHFFPNSEKIISTLPGVVMDFLEGYDQHIISPDPGVNTQESNGLRNINRQIVTSYAGIMAATRKYVIKVRTDTIFINNNILKYIGLWRKKPGFFDDRIYATNLYTLRPDDQPMYISDFVYAGTRADMIKLFSIPLLYHEPKCGPEQYIASQFIMKQFGIIYFSSISNNLSAQLFGNEFCILDGQRQFGILNLKYPQYRDEWCNVMMRHMEWLDLYYANLRS